MMKQYILIMLLALAGLAGMAQTNEPLPGGAVQFSNQLWLNPADSTIWTGDVFEWKFVNLGSWHKVDSLLALKADASDLSDYYTQSQIDAFLALKADASALDDFYTKLEVDGLLGGYVPTSRTVNGKALTGNITLNANDVGALQAGDDVSDLVNDAGYITAGDIPADAVTSVNGMTGAVVVTKSDIGLGNVDNTSDANKPISTATQSALDGKEDKTNKATSLSTPNNTTYPTTQAVKTAIDAIEPPDVTGSNGIQVDDGEISPVYGTAAGTVAQGNDSRINNGQTAFGWGNWNNANLWVNTTSGEWNSPETARRFRTISSNVDGPVGGITFGAFFPHTNENFGTYIAGRSDEFYLRSLEGGTLMPWRRVWHDGNFTPSDYLSTSQRGASNGVASLDGSGKVPTSQLPTTGMQYQGTWNANTNSPTLSNGTGTEGHFYRVTTAGTQNLGSGNITFSVGDDVIHNGSVWQRAPSGATSTNLALGTRTSTTMPITNSNGNGVTLPARTSSLAGLMTSSDLATLNSALQSEADPSVPAHVKAITSGQINNWNTAFGWGNWNNANLWTNSPSGEWNSPETNSRFRTISSNVDGPVGAAAYGAFFPHTNANYGTYIAGRNDVFAMRSLEDGTLMPWRTIWHSGNFSPSDYVATSNFTWSNLSGKPSTFAPSAHTHNASDINAGTLAIGRIPTGTTGSTVALGNHTHPASAITSGTLNIARIPTGTSSSTVAIGNDSRINNGQTAYGWGNHASAGYAVSGTASGQVRTNTQLDARYLQSGDLPTVNNGTLSLSTGTGLTGSASFTANQAGNSSFTVAAASGYAIPTTSQISTWNNAVPNTRQINGKALSSNVTLTNADIGSEPAFSKNTAFNKNFGTAAGTVAQGNDSRIVNAVPNTRQINGKALSANVTLTAADVSAVPLTGNATISGTKTFTSPVKGVNATANDEFVTMAQMNTAVQDNIIRVDSLSMALTDSSIPANSYLSQNYAVNGVITSDVVVVNHDGPTKLIASAKVLTSGTITITIHNPYTTSVSGVPYVNFSVRVIK